MRPSQRLVGANQAAENPVSAETKSLSVDMSLLTGL